MTIVEAIKEVLLTAKKPLTSKEIYAEIIRHHLYDFGAKSPIGVVNSKIRKHCYGLDFPTANPVKHFVVSSKKGNTTKYSLYDTSIKANKDKQPALQQDSQSNDWLPEEKLHDAYLEHRASVKGVLLEQIKSSDPAFFERLVIDLLLSMGYGGDFSDAGLITGSPGDGGIDGVIKEDKLGLDKIYIQAKRYTSQTIGRPDLQQFVGAMENVQKGVFLTTTSFTKTACTYVEKQQKSIVLIDGDRLCDLMITHGVGIATIKTYSTFKVDTDYFSDN